MKSYTSQRIGLLYRISEFVHLYHSHSGNLAENVGRFLEDMRAVEESIGRRLGFPVKGKRILEIGPGQKLMQMHYFGRHNDVVGVDLDVIVRGFNPAAYWRLLRRNGPVRTMKTIGRKMLFLDARFRRELIRQLGTKRLPDVQVLQMNASSIDLPGASFDCVTAFSVFEHLTDPGAVLREVSRLLRPGGVAYINVHLYTSETGAHDMRVLAGSRIGIPLWAHLRPQFQNLVRSSTYLNKIRLPDWRRIFADHLPGVEFEQYPPDSEVLHAHLAHLRDQGELRDYTNEELLTTALVAIYRKAAAVEDRTTSCQHSHCLNPR